MSIPCSMYKLCNILHRQISISFAIKTASAVKSFHISFQFLINHEQDEDERGEWRTIPWYFLDLWHQKDQERNFFVPGMNYFIRFQCSLYRYKWMTNAQFFIAPPIWIHSCWAQNHSEYEFYLVKGKILSSVKSELHLSKLFIF